MVLVVEALTTNILPTNEATLPTFTCSATAIMKILSTKWLNIAQTNVFPPENYRTLYTTACSLIAIRFGASTEASTLRCFHYNYMITGHRLGYGVSVNRYLIMKISPRKNYAYLVACFLLPFRLLISWSGRNGPLYQWKWVVPAQCIWMEHSMLEEGLQMNLVGKMMLHCIHSNLELTAHGQWQSPTDSSGIVDGWNGITSLLWHCWKSGVELSVWS